MQLNKIYQHKFLVNFDDIDWGGVVHHPNYLKYLERARIFAFEAEGIPFQNVIASGFGIVIAEVRMKYLKPLLMGNQLSVYSQMVAHKKSSFKVNQVISKVDLNVKDFNNVFDIGDLSFQCQLRLVWVDLKTGKSIEPPPQFQFPMSSNVKMDYEQVANTRLDM